MPPQKIKIRTAFLPLHAIRSPTTFGSRGLLLFPHVAPFGCWTGSLTSGSGIRETGHLLDNDNSRGQQIRSPKLMMPSGRYRPLFCEADFRIDLVFESLLAGVRGAPHGPFSKRRERIRRTMLDSQSPNPNLSLSRRDMRSLARCVAVVARRQAVAGRRNLWFQAPVSSFVAGRRILGPATRHLAKKAKKKKHQDPVLVDVVPSAEEEDEADIVHDVLSNEFIESFKAKMEATISQLEKQLSRMRGSRASPELFDTVKVEAYGRSEPLLSVAQVSIKSATLIEVTCFDPQLATSVAASLKAMEGFSLNPQPVGKTGKLSVPFPRPSTEAREAIAKAAHQAVEQSKQRTRRIRHKALEELKRDSDALPKDDVRRQAALVDKATEDATKRLTMLGDNKKSDLLQTS